MARGSAQSSGSARRLFVLFVAGALTFGLLFVLADIEGSDEAPRGAVAARPEAPAPTVQLPEVAQGLPVALPVEAEAPTPAPAVPRPGPLRDSSRVVGLADLPHDLYSGRVLDEHERPVAGARVYFVPAHSAWHVLGQNLWWAQQVDAADLPSTLTGADGRFTLRGPGVESCRDDEQGGDYWAGAPGLVVVAPGRTNHPHVCLHHRRGDYEAGDLRVEPQAALRGRLVDEQGAPVAGATLTWIIDSVRPALLPKSAVQADDGDLIEIFARTESDARGEFLLEGLWQGSGQLHVQGQLVSSMSVEDVELVSGGITDLRDVIVAHGATITGLVLDADGRPVPGAELALVEDEGHGEAPGDADALLALVAWGSPWFRKFHAGPDGRFVVGGLPHDEDFDLVARAPGHDPGALRDLVPDSGPHELRLRRQALLDVTVVDEADDSVPSEVQLTATRVYDTDDVDPEPLPVEPLPDAEGRPAVWRVRGVGGLGTRLFVAAPGYARQRVQAEVVAEGGQGRHVVRLIAESLVTGRVLDTNGAGIADVLVMAEHIAGDAEGEAGSEAFARTRSGPDGRYRLAQLAAGQWSLWTEAPGWMPVRDVTVRAGDGRRDEDLILARASRIEGVLTNRDGFPALGAEVELQRLRDGVPDEDDVKSASSGAGGRYLFDHLSPGTWLVRWRSVRSVVVGAGETVRVDFEEPALPRVSGRLLGIADGDQEHTVMAQLLSDELGYERQQTVRRTVRDGRFELGLPVAGTWRLFGSVTGSGRLTPVVEFEVGWGEPVARDLVLGTSRVRGTVVDAAQGRPLAKARVSLTSGAYEDFTLGVLAGEDGAFVFEGLVPGRYRVTATASGHRANAPLAFEVAEGAEAEPLALALAAQSTVRFTLVPDASQEPDDWSIVYVFDESRERVIHANWAQPPQPVVINTLAPGRYWAMLVTLRNGQPFATPTERDGMTPLQLEEGRTTEVVLVARRIDGN